MDGAIHPELIPDAIAYRLYFAATSVGPNATDEDRKRQLAQLDKLGFQDMDRAILIDVLAEFRRSHDALATQFEKDSKAALIRNASPDILGFRKQIDQLVQFTRDALKLRLPPEVMAQFDAFVQSEKRLMRLHGVQP